MGSGWLSGSQASLRTSSWERVTSRSASARWTGCSTSSWLLHRDDVGGLDVRFLRQEVIGYLTECGGDLAVQVRLSPVLTFEGVEDAVRRVAELELVPRDRALLLGSERAALLQEGGELITLAGLGLEQGEQSSVDGHGVSSRGWAGRSAPP